MATMTLATAKKGTVTIILKGSGAATISWGDGNNSNSYTLSTNESKCTHDYTNTTSRTITITGNTMTYLNCTDNQLTNINVIGNALLEYLNCSFNNLTSLNLTGLTKLKELNCSLDNCLGTLNLSNFTNLTKLNCYDAHLTSLKVTGCTNLKEIMCGANNLGALDLKNLTNLTTLSCENSSSFTGVTSLNLAGCTNLKEIECRGNSLLKTLDTSGLINLKTLNCDKTTVVTSNSAPTITTQPVSKSVVESTSTSFSIVATGEPTPTYSWEISKDSGSTWSAIGSTNGYSGALTKTLTITTPTTAMSGYKYRCVVKNSVGTVTSSVATLTITSATVAPTITTQPVSKSVVEGTSTSFSIVATGEPAPTYSWEISKDSGSTWSAIGSTNGYSGALTKILTITSPTIAMSGYRYRCVVKNSKGEAISSAATLTITSATATPTITTQPGDKTVKIGQTAEFTVVATGAPTPTYKWEYSKNGGHSWDEIKDDSIYDGATKQKLTIRKAKENITGYRYHCVVKNSVGSVTSNAASLTVKSMTSSIQLQQTQIDLYGKLELISQPSYEVLKKKVQNRKLPRNGRILKEELEVAELYFTDFDNNIKDFNEKWHPDCPLQDFTWFNSDVIKKLLELFKRQQEVSSSLIPIKGISKIMQAKLKNHSIYDIGSLLSKGKTQEKRNTLAHDLDVDVRSVNIWVKQAHLWRIDGMTTDTAYMLVQIGVRNPEDLSKLDENIAYPILERLAWAQPDFYLINKLDLAQLIENAKGVDMHTCADGGTFWKLFQEAMENRTTPLTEKEMHDLFEKSKHVSSIAIGIETWDEEPQHLFRVDEVTIEMKTSEAVIREGLEFLNDVPLALPLPYAISGQVVMEKIDQTHGEYIGYGGVLVEISGISSSTTDKNDKEKIPSAYSDSEGKFRVILPEKLNLQEGIFITVSKGLWKQKFLKSATDIINSVPQQEILRMFYELKAIADILAYKDTLDARLSMLEYDLKAIQLQKKPLDDKVDKNEDLTQAEIKRLTEFTQDKCRIEQEIADLKAIKEDIDQKEKNDKSRLETEYNNKKQAIINKYTDLKNSSKPYSNDLEIILQNLVASDNQYEAMLEKGSIVLIKEIFEGYNISLERALPCVKLMGENETAIKLPTDTAPSRVFNYIMLQRLIEPALGPLGKTRKKLEAPVDVMDFKTKLYTNPDTYPQMCSLGIGYILNMHQAWVPDGFALGTLLYSLILAPGEEQRLIVRENKQEYTVSDEAMGVDSDSQTYDLSQVDDTTAAYDYAVNQLSKANSSYQTYAKTKSSGWSIGGSASGGGGGFSVGLSGGYSSRTSTTRTNGSASASQSNSHNEASSAAQNFQHSIKSAADRISQSKRVSVRTASSAESNSVATKIIANHNHSHAMTIQYWEVMRRFRLETCIDGIELVLFVPLKLIKFIPDGVYTPNLASFNRDKFLKRYEVLLKYADQLLYSLPYKYCAGLNLIKKYAAYPNWKLESTEAAATTLRLSFKCNFLEFDDASATLVLKNGKGVVAGELTYDRNPIEREYTGTPPEGFGFETSLDLKKAIKAERNKKGKITHTCTFILPPGVVDEDIAHIRIDHSYEDFNYTLYQDPDAKTASGSSAASEYQYMMDKYWDSVKDTKDTKADRRKMEYCKNILPEAWTSPNVSLSARSLKLLGNPIVSDVKLTGNSNLTAMPSGSTINSSLYINIASGTKTLLYSELQEMESLMHHIAADTLHYSQVIWGSLGDDERAMMLEQYTIDMDFGGLQEVVDDEGNITTSPGTINIPLLNCVNIKKMLGFYGNCILLPFTYPKALAKKLGKTAAEVQDALYRYHTHYFRVPTTVVSLPTDGMIGEAVLGETNVSELIDLTRFWNWKDSPIDKMEIDSTYLNDTDYLADKNASAISALNVQGATAPTAATMPDLLTAMINKQAPTFNDITGLEQLKDVMNNTLTSASEGRKEVANSNTEIMKAATELMKAAKAEPKAEQESAADKKLKELTSEKKELDKQIEIKKLEADIEKKKKEINGESSGGKDDDKEGSNDKDDPSLNDPSGPDPPEEGEGEPEGGEEPEGKVEGDEETGDSNENNLGDESNTDDGEIVNSEEEEEEKTPEDGKNTPIGSGDVDPNTSIGQLVKIFCSNAERDYNHIHYTKPNDPRLTIGFAHFAKANTIKLLKIIKNSSDKNVVPIVNQAQKRTSENPFTSEFNLNSTKTCVDDWISKIILTNQISVENTETIELPGSALLPSNYKRFFNDLKKILNLNTVREYQLKLWYDSIVAGGMKELETYGDKSLEANYGAAVATIFWRNSGGVNLDHLDELVTYFKTIKRLQPDGTETESLLDGYETEIKAVMIWFRSIIANERKFNEVRDRQLGTWNKWFKNTWGKWPVEITKLSNNKVLTKKQDVIDYIKAYVSIDIVDENDNAIKLVKKIENVIHLKFNKKHHMLLNMDNNNPSQPQSAYGNSDLTELIKKFHN